jgi:hypothetical protein
MLQTNDGGEEAVVHLGQWLLRWIGDGLISHAVR